MQIFILLCSFTIPFIKQLGIENCCILTAYKKILIKNIKVVANCDKYMLNGYYI